MKRVLFLGSSIFYGFSNNGFSFVDLLKETINHIDIVKETVNGTTLALQENRKDSYIERLKNIFNESNKDYDLVFIQLSTNDFNLSLNKGKILKNTTKYNLFSICGAIEYICFYINQLNPKTKIYFITCPTLKSYKLYSQYKSFINNELKEISIKHKINILNLSDSIINEGDFVDDIHPSINGYKNIFYKPVLDIINKEINI